MAIRRSSGLARRRVGRFEKLENRDFLSADACIGQLTGVGPALAADVSGPAFSVQRLEISIVGTDVSYSAAGLPMEMKGLVYLDTAAGVSAASIGSYDESLQPIFAPVGPSGALEFVGTTGICTFDFDLQIGNTPLTIGSIVTSDTALIAGALPGGTIVVGSSNSPITGAAGICSGLTGTFNSQSEVRLGTSFYMHTTVDFQVTDQFGVDIKEALTGLAIADSAIGQDYVTSHWGKSLANDQGDAAHAALSHLDWLADKSTAVDNVLVSESEGSSLPT